MLVAITALVFEAPAFALGAAPVLALLLLLSARCFPGESTIARLRDRRTARPPRTPEAPAPLPRLRRPAARGRLVICFALANRPPPVAHLSA